MSTTHLCSVEKGGLKKVVHKAKCHGCKLAGSLCIGEIYSGKLEITVAPTATVSVSVPSNVKKNR